MWLGWADMAHPTYRINEVKEKDINIVNCRKPQGLQLVLISFYYIFLFASSGQCYC